MGAQICSCMAALTEHGRMHRDLATRNVLVFSYHAPTPSGSRLLKLNI